MKKKQLLFVDDEPWGTEPLRLKLEGRGFLCDIATDMSSAMKLLEKKSFDVIVTDIMMPSGEDYPEIESYRTGIEFMNKVIQKFPGAQIICLSVVGDQEIINSLKKKGILYLRKGETSLATAAKLIETKASGIVSFGENENTRNRR